MLIRIWGSERVSYGDNCEYFREEYFRERGNSEYIGFEVFNKGIRLVGKAWVSEYGESRRKGC